MHNLFVQFAKLFNKTNKPTNATNKYVGMTQINIYLVDKLLTQQPKVLLFELLDLGPL
jgi:hypothetical protein